MRNALTVFASAASLCLLATAAGAQDYYPNSGPTIPSQTGAPLYSYHHTRPQPGAVGSCDIIAGNRVCSAAPAGYGPNTAGPFGVFTAPFAVIGAPFGVGAAPVGASGGTYAPATGTAVWNYESQVPPQPGTVGYCDLISGNRICFP
jgi:hypothetical protein